MFLMYDKPLHMNTANFTVQCLQLKNEFKFLENVYFCL